jgi:hypothetical protein
MFLLIMQDATNVHSNTILYTSTQWIACCLDVTSQKDCGSSSPIPTHYTEPKSQDAKPRVQPEVHPPFIEKMWGGEPRVKPGPWRPEMWAQLGLQFGGAGAVSRFSSCSSIHNAGHNPDVQKKKVFFIALGETILLHYQCNGYSTKRCASLITINTAYHETNAFDAHSLLHKVS